VCIGCVVGICMHVCLKHNVTVEYSTSVSITCPTTGFELDIPNTSLEVTCWYNLTEMKQKDFFAYMIGLHNHSRYCYEMYWNSFGGATIEFHATVAQFVEVSTWLEHYRLEI
jgi:hypothetical protein